MARVNEIMIRFEGNTDGLKKAAAEAKNEVKNFEGDAKKSGQAIEKAAPGIPDSLKLPNPLGPKYGGFAINVPFDTGVSMRVNILPKELRGIIQKREAIASKVHDWTLSDVVKAKKAINEAIEEAYGKHRSRVYNGKPLTFSEGDSEFYVDRSKVLDMLSQAPVCLSEFGEGTPSRLVGLGVELSEILDRARKDGYTAVRNISPDGYVVWTPTSKHYKASTEKMKSYAESKGYVKVDSLGRQIGD